MPIMKLTWQEFIESAQRDIKARYPEIDETSGLLLDRQGQPTENGKEQAIAFIEFNLL